MATVKKGKALYGQESLRRESTTTVCGVLLSTTNFAAKVASKGK